MPISLVSPPSLLPKGEVDELTGTFPVSAVWPETQLSIDWVCVCGRCTDRASGFRVRRRKFQQLYSENELEARTVTTNQGEVFPAPCSRGLGIPIPHFPALT